MRGTAVRVPVLEAGSVVRIGRFGWKSQHASLESFSADAYLNEMGITSPLFPDENTSSGRNVGYGTPYDPLPDPEDDGIDIVAFADFMRASKAPSRGEIDQDVLMGERIFDDIGCDICHVPTIETAPTGTQINAGAFVVPEALGEKLIHPYSDFLLHDIGTGDGIPVLPLRSTQIPSTRFARLRCGRCARAIASCTTVSRSRLARRSNVIAARHNTQASALPACLPKNRHWCSSSSNHYSSGSQRVGQGRPFCAASTRAVAGCLTQALLRKRRETLAEREESIPLRRVLFHNGFFKLSNIRTINIRPDSSG